MRMQEIITRELEAMGGPLHMLETGSIRSAAPQYRDGDGWSTVAFARYAKEHGGSFTSIDLNIQAAREVLGDPGLCGTEGLSGHTELVEGDTRTALFTVCSRLEASGSLLDVVLLDSANDAELIMEEFAIVRPFMRDGALLLVDDVIPGSASVTKGHKILPHLEAHGYKPIIIARDGDGFTTGVLRVTL